MEPSETFPQRSLNLAKTDPLTVVERRIEEAFQKETAQARQKRDRALAAIRLLRTEYGNNGDLVVEAGPNSTSVLQDDSENEMRDDAGSADVSLKQAMLEAIRALEFPITRRKVLERVYAMYPHLRDSKEGTIASTFSRLKGAYLEEANEGEERFVFRLKTLAPLNGQETL